VILSLYVKTKVACLPVRVVQWLGEGSLLYQLSSHENETVVKTLYSDPESKCTREKVEKGTLCRNGLVEFINGEITQMVPIPK
jgi:hypothetical protein